MANTENAGSKRGTVSVSIRIERATWERFRRVAESECRSAASLLRLLIRDAADRHRRDDRTGRGGVP